jgi:transglutaminase-like putative cysteine protease
MIAMAETMRYCVVHETQYSYESAVSISRQALHLAPQSTPYQRCIRHELRIEPAPTYRIDEIDCFGNPLTRLEIDTPHRELLIAAEMEVDVMAHAGRIDLDASPSWQAAIAEFAYVGEEVPSSRVLEASRYRFESPFIRFNPDLADFARDCFSARTPLLRACANLMSKIHREFRFDSSATQIATPLAEVLEKRHGVCQDFAHLMIGCLRTLGLPARYVSGYLLTVPPPGKQRLVGADASHAWVSVHCPQYGWVDFDPTNDVRPDLGHIRLAWGRDFGDVSPLRGIILGGSEHELDVRVTVTPTDGQSPSSIPIVQP